MAARLFHKLKLLDKAEELYIGALVLDPEVGFILSVLFLNTPFSPYCCAPAYSPKVT